MRWTLLLAVTVVACGPADPLDAADLEQGPIELPPLPDFAGPVGTVMVSVLEHPRVRSSVTVAFADAPEDFENSLLAPFLLEAPVGCEPIGLVDRCRLITCEEATPPYPYPHGGELTMGTVVQQPDAGSGRYPGIQWEQGGPIESGVPHAVSWVGDTVPAAALEVAPPERFTTPDIDYPETFDQVVIPVSEPWTIAWSDTSDDPTTVTLVGVEGATAVCAFDSTAGWGQVPVSVLERVQGAGFGNLRVERYAVETVPVGPFTVARIGRAEALFRQVAWED